MNESTGGSSPAREPGTYRGTTDQFGETRGQERTGGGPGSPRERGAMNQVKEKVGEWSDAAVEKTKELVEEGKTLAQRAKESAKDWAHTAGEKVDSARAAVGGGLESFGGSLREKGSSASATVGNKLEAAGAYLREHDFGGMADSMKDVVRRHPVQSVFVGIGLGFILARATTRRG